MATTSASDLMVALVQAASTLPASFLSILAGAIADSFSRRGVMLAGHCLIALASMTLALSVGLGFVSPWLILGLGFLAGCGFALNDPAWHASVGDILENRLNGTMALFFGTILTVVSANPKHPHHPGGEPDILRIGRNGAGAISDRCRRRWDVHRSVVGQ